MTTRTLATIVPAVLTSDGAGVKLYRSLGAKQALRLDPFLLLDEFSSEQAADYIGGFPPHPHRGFETVTYMLAGRMLHRDHLGNRGELVPGAVQWMSAGRGIIHSEMPQQTEGRLHGFQLWINLPAAEKMMPAAYRDIPPDQIPQVEIDSSGRVKVIAGVYQTQSGHNIGGNTPGPIQGLTTDPLYFAIELPAGVTFGHPLDAAYNAFVYPFEGTIAIGNRPLAARHAGLLSSGERVEIQARTAARFLLLAARPLNEPVVQYGPFVMNTKAEIEQAMRDYREGRLTG